MLLRAWMCGLAAFVCTSAVVDVQQNAAQRAAWNEPVAPFRIIGNVYYVGAAGVSAFLIHTPEGSILLDGGLPETAPRIVENIRGLGFDPRGVKHLLNSHAHYDHAGGLAELKRVTGASLAASHGDASRLRDGGPDMRPVRVDTVLTQGSKISVGGATMVAHMTPGHTQGCTTWTTTVREGGRDYKVLFHCSTSVVDTLIGNKDYPHIVSDYLGTFARLEKMEADVFLGAHPSFFSMDEKRKRMQAGSPNPFVDPGELRRFNASSRKQFEAALAKERAALPIVGDPEEYAIYKMLAKRSEPVRGFGASELVMKEETESGLRRSCTASIPEEQPEWREVFERWQAANASPARIRADRELGLPYRVRPASEIYSYFTGPSALHDGWQRFYADYPKARAFFTVSRAGFSSDRNRAFVYFSHSCGGLCGQGQFFTLEKKGADWQPVTVAGAKLCMWIS